MGRTGRLVLVLLVALATAAVASYAVYTAIQRVPTREVEIATVQAVVAARPVTVGTVLTSDDVKLIGWPASSPVEGAFSDTAAVVRRGVITELLPNEIITESKLAPEGTGGGLPPQIPVGMRALSVRVNEVIGVAGFVVPGTRVDVLVTVRQSNDQPPMSRVVVSNLQVLTAGTRLDQERTANENKPVQATVVTLLVTPEDAEKVALAQSEGSIMLALRNPLDVAPVETPGVRMAGLMGPAAPPPVEKRVGPRKVVVAAPPAPPPPKPYTVEAIRGAKRTEEPIR